MNEIETDGMLTCSCCEVAGSIDDPTFTTLTGIDPEDGQVYVLEAWCFDCALEQTMAGLVF